MDALASHSRQCELSFVLLILTILIGIRRNLKAVLICISLLAKDFFRCFLAIWVSSVENSGFFVPVFKLGCFLIPSFLSSLRILDYQPFIRCIVGKILFPFCRLQFCLNDGVLCCAEVSQFLEILFNVFSSESLLLCRGSRLFPNFSSVRFSVSALILNSLIHLKLNFVQSDKCGSLCILLYVVIQFDQHLWLKMMSFPVCIFLILYKKIRSP